MMKKLILAILLFTTPAMASPFLVCDPQVGVTGYVLLVNGVEVTTPAPLHYDLAGVPVGPNEISVRAYNMWGESTPVPFEFVRPASVGSPANIKLEK